MDLNDFMARLTANAAPSGKTPRANGGTERGRSLEKISLNFPGNFGSYQLLPVNSQVIDYPFVQLSGTREVCIPRRRTTQDGTEETYSVWIKLLPKSAYVMKDLTGRLTSSLTAEDESILDSAYSIWDQINEEINKGAETEDQKAEAYKTKMALIRKRNYTIFNAYCISKWDMNDTKTPVRNNFSGLFIATASGFSSNLKSDIDQKSLMYGGNVEFINEIYSNAQSGRTGALFLTINRPAGQTTYNVSFSHNAGLQNLASITIPDSDYELMKDPLEAFLGWQARRDEETPIGQRRLFNASLIREAISYMTRQLAAIRMAKQNHTDVLSAIEATNAAALSEATPASNVTTNDPMLKAAAGASGETYAVDANHLNNVNTNPFQTPPAARMDPISGSPVAPEAAPTAAPFSQPSFGFGSGSAAPGGMPF
jgi:hypothetical protein